MQCKRCQRFGHTKRNCGHAPRCVAYGASHLPGGCTTPTKHTNPFLLVPTNPFEEISDLLHRIPLQTCVELTRRLLTSISYLPTGRARPMVVLTTVILFVAEYGSTP